MKFLLPIMLCLALLAAPEFSDADSQTKEMLRTLVEAQRQDQANKQNSSEEDVAQKARMARLVDQSLAKLDRRSILDQALKIARNIDDHGHRARALCYVAVAADNDEIFDEVEDALNSDEERISSAIVLLLNVKYLIASGEYNQAKRFVKLEGIAKHREEHFCAIAAGQAKAGDIENAELTTRELKEQGRIDYVKCYIVRAHMERGSTDQAIITAQSIKTDRFRPWATCIIATRTQNKELFSKTLAAAQSIEDKNKRSSALRFLAISLLTTGDLAQADKIIQAIDIPEEKKRSLISLASSYAVSGNFDRAYSILKDFPVNTLGNAVMNGVVVLHAEKGNKDEAVAIARIIRDDFDKAGVLWTIAEKTNDPALLVEAKEVLSNIGDKVRKKDVLSIIAPIEAKLLGIEKAKQTLKKLTQESDLVQALCEIARQYPENK